MSLIAEAKVKKMYSLFELFWEEGGGQKNISALSQFIIDDS